ncbi:MAG: hypothetical protein E7268_04770 [Lachnospiraceae bacterium]|nr:hypothetical protein [Lachnospiraceae bacterium]
MDIVFSVLAWTPGILFVLVIFARFIWPLIVRGIIKSAEKKGNICDVCKGNMIELSEHFRILPVRFDEKHDCSAEYYIHSTTPVKELSQVPSGSRGCKIYLLQCQNCGCKEVAVIDILPVRGQEILKNADVFPYEEFREFYETDGVWGHGTLSETINEKCEIKNSRYGL